MSVTVASSLRAPAIGKIAQIDMLEDEEDAVFSDGDESISVESDDGVEDSFDADELAKSGASAAIPSHLAFLAGAIESYPSTGYAVAGPSADDDEEEYIPDTTGKADAVMLGSTAPVQRVIVDLGQLHLNLRDAEVKAQAEKAKVKARADAIDDEEAEFSDSDAESDEEMDDARNEADDDHLRFLSSKIGDVSMEDDDDDEYRP